MENRDDFERPFFIPKAILDSVNSITWFFADALWMLDAIDMGVGLMIPTIVTGLLLLYVEKRRPIILINVSINCWIWMNALWMMSDTDLQGNYLVAAKVCFYIGCLFILLAAYYSKSIRETFSHFKRFRGIKT